MLRLPVLRKNLNAAKPLEQSKGLGGNISCNPCVVRYTQTMIRKEGEIRYVDYIISNISTCSRKVTGSTLLQGVMALTERIGPIAELRGNKSDSASVWRMSMLTREGMAEPVS